ncbi:DNA polymerase III subunit gamma/tau [bacterium]|nr:DNA polymerase III subunit gamma/tau [bacterium]
MAYQVVARKWRPQRFDEVVGQDHVTSTLKYAILNKRTAPVYLFTGIRGTGKTTMARILVKALNCTDLQPDGEPCNKCECCREISEGRSPDVVEIDGASNNSVDDVRDIKENISYSPVKSKFKVYIIDEVHMLSKSAFNALLKTLEEPPAHSIFILATTDPQKIPTTVLSRCQRYDLKRLSLDDVAHQLAKILDAEQKEYDMAALYAIAREGEGSMRDSQTILEQLITFGGGKVTENEISMILGASDKNQLRGIIESIAKHDSTAAVSFARDIYKSGKSIEKAARDILSLLHEILLFSELGNEKFIEAPAEETEWIKSCSELASTPDWTRLFRFWNDEYEGIKSSDFALMLFEVAVITACSFPTMNDFRNFAKNISSAASTMPQNGQPAEKKTAEPVKTVGNKQKPEPETAEKQSIIEEKPEKTEKMQKPVPDNVEKAEKQELWRDFTETFKESDPFLYGRLQSWPYQEDDKSVSVTLTVTLSSDGEDFAQRLKSLFDNFSKGRKAFSVSFEKGENKSIFTEDELHRMEEIEKRKKNMIESGAVKAAVQMGFEIKGVSAE